MLAKQWLQAYPPGDSGSPHDRACLRQLRLMHLKAWRVSAIIDTLPLLLHLALLLFFAGLIVLLWTVNIIITLATCVIVIFAYVFYFASILVSCLYPDCPYHHPLSDQFRKWLIPTDIVVKQSLHCGSDADISGLEVGFADDASRSVH